MTTPNTVSPEGTRILHYFEDLALKAYPDPYSPLGRALQRDGLWASTLLGRDIPIKYGALSGDPWTIGRGDTGPHVKRGDSITAEEADVRYDRRIAQEFLPGVRAALRVAVTQEELDALVSFAYNVGLANYRTSTLLRKLNAGDRKGAAAEFPRWDRANNIPSLGLKRRREAERLRFLGASAAEAIAAAQRLK